MGEIPNRLVAPVPPPPPPPQVVEPPQAPDPGQDIGPLARFLGGTYMVVLNVVVVYLLIKIWPDETTPKTGVQEFYAFFGKLHCMLSMERRFLLIAVLAGALGSYIHAATSFADFLGNRKFVKSWTWWYLLRPFIGVALALLVYFASRGGLISATTGAGDLSPYGVAALTGLAGLFSKQATDKLREVFETLFKAGEPTKREDKL
jgi:hypothetical protein